MPKILCCLCSRRTGTSKQRARVGTNSNWELLKMHVEKNGLDLSSFSEDDYVCMKCHASLAHYGMKDRGPNKTAKNVAPTTFEQGIKKTSLRGYTKFSGKSEAQSKSKSSESNVAVNRQISTNSVDSIDLNSLISARSVAPSSLISSTYTNEVVAAEQIGPSAGSQQTVEPVETHESSSQLDILDSVDSSDSHQDFNSLISAPSSLITLPDTNEVVAAEQTGLSAGPQQTVQPVETHESSSQLAIFDSADSSEATLSSIMPEQREETIIRDSQTIALPRKQNLRSDSMSTCDIRIACAVEPDCPSTEASSIVTSSTRQKGTMSPSADESLNETVSSTTEPCLVNPSPLSLESASAVNTIHLQGVKTTQSRCFICCSKDGRKAIPWTAIRQAWFDMRCYIPKTNQTCEGHLTRSHLLDEESVHTITTLMQDVYVEIKVFEPWIHAVSDIRTSTAYSFEEDRIAPEDYKMLLGIEKDSFDDWLQYLKGMRNTSTRSLRNALAMFLLLMRNNMKQELIAFNFSTTQQAVSKTIDSVSLALEENFVPKYLGYHHITREEALEKHSIKLVSKVLGQPEARMCVIADGTYNYIEKPSDFILQRKTFSLHKRRNLLKPLYIIFPNGYILEAAGPYFCDSKNNDAANIRHHYENSDSLLFLDEEDHFLLDRGYRDVVDETVEKNFSVFMPSLLTGKRTHFDCDEANSSRMVTMFRWVVEAVNGRIKNVFPFFKHTIEGTYAPKIMRFNRIVCAMMNKYFPPLVYNKEFHDTISEVCASEIPKTNELKQEIEHLGLKRMTKRWEKASASSVTDFPELSMDDLRRITIGSYQIKIAERYIEAHLKEGNDFGIFVYRQMDGIIRARIQSRFSNSKSHDTWVKFDGGGRGYEAIKGLYCTCKVGERTLGCCSHLTSILRYLGFERHQPQKLKVRQRVEWDAIDCNDSSDGNSSDDHSEIDVQTSRLRSKSCG